MDPAVGRPVTPAQRLLMIEANLTAAQKHLLKTIEEAKDSGDKSTETDLLGAWDFLNLAHHRIRRIRANAATPLNQGD